MIKLFIDKNQLSKVDLKITTAGLYTECAGCKNSFAVGNSEGFNQNVREMLENKLIYEGIDEKGVLELNYAFECPACFRKKLVPLEFKLEMEKTVLIFGTKIGRNAESLAKSARIFEKQIQDKNVIASEQGERGNLINSNEKGE